MNGEDQKRGDGEQLSVTPFTAGDVAAAVQGLIDNRYLGAVYIGREDLDEIVRIVLTILCVRGALNDQRGSSSE